MNENQLLLLGLIAAAWLYYSQRDPDSQAAQQAGGSQSIGGGTVSTDNTTATGYGLPGWQSLNSSFYTGE